jgi:hypothetical protein
MESQIPAEQEQVDMTSEAAPISFRRLDRLETTSDSNPNGQS